MMLAALCRPLNDALYFSPAPATALPATPPLRVSPCLSPPPSSLHHGTKITSLKTRLTYAPPHLTTSITISSTSMLFFLLPSEFLGYLH
ncbi:hypothetical protein E2C01_087263 [Portunus trituberculatus]|uniref:Uncharacterized protein n=1 Tax=Portunus trituberculatus TaxID=210409 RepID=A0A5B7JBG2_PORTR|nr:hypothetical protein [Portunus trituberculatus]